MATARIPTADFSLSSSWQCDHHYPGGKPYYAFKSSNMPTYASQEVSFDYSLPSGSAIKTAQIWATIGSALTGCSILNVNGNAFKHTSGSERGADVSISGTSGTLSATFAFKANGNKVDTARHSSTVTFKNVYLWIEYEGGSDSTTVPAPTPPKLTGLAVPPQSVAIYDPSDGKVYMFDGVVKIQHALSMKIEEEPEKHKEEYTNNARNEPDKLTLDVVMSDVYDGEGAIVSARGFTDAERSALSATKSSLMSIDAPRSENAFYVLHDLKEARKKLCVITPQFVHTDMILASVTVNQDEEHPYGWEGQIVFQHTYKAQTPKPNNSKPSNNKPVPPSPANGLLSGLTNAVSTGLKKLGSWITGKK